MPRRTPAAPTMADAALVTIAVWPTIVIALTVLQRHTYHPLSWAVSDLVHGRGGQLMAVAFGSLAAGLLLLAWALRLSTSARVGPALLALAGLLTIVSAYAHADPANAPSTTTGQVHQTAGIITFILIVVAMFALTRPFRDNDMWRAFSGPTLAWAIAAIPAFFLIPLMPDHLFGLAQRIFITVWLTWLLAASYRARTAGSKLAVATPARALSRHVA
jgi:Protein of unknown function (DUF998)